jgi:hypothetical protein
MQQGQLGDLWLDQDEHPIAEVGEAATAQVTERAGQGVVEEAVERQPHGGPDRIASLRPTESLDVQRKDRPVDRLELIA